jgi:glycosyltransferase involved in cell wall biosynthesis
MKVCVTGLRGIPQVMGGIETHCEQLYPRLKARAAHLDIEVLARGPYVAATPYVHEGVRVTPLAAPTHKYLEAISHTLLCVLYARFVARAGLIHIHGIGPGVLTPLAKALGLKVVVTHHGQDYKRKKWNAFAQAVLELGEWCSIAAADRVIVVGRSLAGELKRRHAAHEAKIDYVPNGMTSPEPFSGHGGGGLLQRYGLKPGGFVLGVGRLVPEKGFHDLVEAFEGLKTDMKLVIAGASNHEDRYSRELLQRGGERIVFTGALPRDDLAELYRSAALFVHPSSHEGLPIAVLEAIAFGSRVLISDIGPNLDIDLPPRHYFPVGEVPELRRRLDGSFADLAVDAGEVARRFDWDQVAARTAEVYRACEPRQPV